MKKKCMKGKKKLKKIEVQKSRKECKNKIGMIERYNSEKEI